MDSIQAGAEIDGPRAERIFDAARHVTRQVRTALQHLRGRSPVRPFALAADRLGAGPREALASHADAGAKRGAVAEHVIQSPLARRNDDGARRLAPGPLYLLARYRLGAEDVQE